MPDRTPYDVARSASVWTERAARGRLFLSGPDRASYLQGLLTNDIKAIRPGGGCYAAWLTPQGRMTTDMRIYELGDGMLITLPASTAASTRDRLEELIFAEDVAVEDRTATWAQIGVHGPSAASDLARALGSGNLRPLGPFESRRVALGGTEVVVARTDELGGGFDVFAAGGGDDVRRALVGAAVPRAGEDLVEVLRVEAGVPEFGVDMQADTIPLEAGIEARAISFTKGCYVGQEVIVRVLHRGQGRVARRLVGLTIGERGDAPPVPAARAAITVDGREVGRVTSAVRSPALECAIALGYVHRGFIEPGTRLLVADGDRRLSAVVTALPFVPIADCRLPIGD